jgi:hypothetical protein
MPKTPEPGATPEAGYPRFAILRASGVYTLATLALAWPALAGQFLVNPRSDQYIAGYAFREFAASVLRETGQFPLWNPYLFGGLPYVAAMHGDIFYPTFLLRLVLPTDVAMTWGFVIHLFLAGLFTFVFLRALGLGFAAAIIGGLAYMLGGNIAGLASPGHDGKLFISALLPLTLLMLLHAVRGGRFWAFGALAFVIGLAVLTPHPQLLQYLLLAGGAFALFLAFTDTGPGRLSRHDALRRLLFAAIAVGLGLAIGAIQFLPVREYVPWSPRAPGHSWEVATSYSMPPEEVLSFYLPQFSGMLDQYWGRNPIHLHSEYIGASVLILFGLAFLRGASALERRLRWFWLGSLTVALLWAMGGFTPFFRLVYVLVPGTKFFRAPSTMLFVVAFCTAVLAALGTERALRGEISRRYLSAWAVVAAGMAALGVAGGLTNLAVSIAVPGRTDMALANDAAVRLGALRSTLFAGVSLGILFLLATRRVTVKVAGTALAAAVATDLWSIARSYWIFSQPARVLFASDPTIDHLKRETEPGRVLPLELGGAVVPRDPYFYGDALMTHGVRSPLGYHGNELGNYQRVGQRDAGWASVANPNFWSLENVRFILSDTDSIPFPGTRRVAGPARNSAGTIVYLHQLAAENPAAWLTPVIVKAPDDRVLATILDPRFDVRRAALFDTVAAVQGKEIQSLPEPLSIRARVTRFTPGAIDVQLEQPAPDGSALVVSENYYPGWRATVDGAPAVTGRVDATLIGVELPAGGRSVQLRFESRPYELGKAITLATLAVALLWWGGGAALDRRGRTTSA